MVMCIPIVGIAFSYSGGFLVHALMNDIVDYDELLCGRRREGSYLMASLLSTKVVAIPFDFLLLFMSYVGYVTPLNEQTSCADTVWQTSGNTSADMHCKLFYDAETTGEHLCDSSLTCAEYLSYGASITCQLATQHCGAVQNLDVQNMLRMMMSFFPMLVVGIAIILFSLLPREMRHEQSRAQMLKAILDQREGNIVEDPWRPGYRIHPHSRTIVSPNRGVLSYLRVSELRKLRDTANDGENVNVKSVKFSPAISTALTLCMLAGGFTIFIFNVPSLWNSQDSPYAPLGFLVVVVFSVLLYFHLSRLLAVQELQTRTVARSEVIETLNQIAPFIGTEIQAADVVVGLLSGPSDVKTTDLESSTDSVALREFIRKSVPASPRVPPSPGRELPTCAENNPLSPLDD